MIEGASLSIAGDWELRIEALMGEFDLLGQKPSPCPSKGVRQVLRRLLFCIALIAMAVPAAAVAHVTLQPGEWEPGAFATVVVRVPNERDDAETTTVTVQFPVNIPSARSLTDVRARGPARRAR